MILSTPALQALLKTAAISGVWHCFPLYKPLNMPSAFSAAEPGISIIRAPFKHTFDQRNFVIFITKLNYMHYETKPILLRFGRKTSFQMQHLVDCVKSRAKKTRSGYMEQFMKT